MNDPSKKIVTVGFSTAFCLILITLFFLLLKIVSGVHFFSILIGYLITTINFSVGVLWVRKSLKVTNETFIKSLLSGMGMRLFGILLLIILCWKFLDINEISFIFSILFFYFFYLIIEILYINRRNFTG